MSRRVRILAIVAATAAVVAAAVIGGTVLAGTATGGHTAGPGTGAAGTATPSAGPATAGGATVTVGDADNGGSVNLAVGDQLVVVLASTYWHFATPDTTGVLADRGPATVAASPPGHGCVPGAGCGTVTLRFTAVSAGQATVAADRTVCGEALACTGGNGAYRLHVVVK